jgi:hypothetical protein
VISAESFAGMLWRVAVHVNEFRSGYFSFSYSALACFRREGIFLESRAVHKWA